MAFSDSHCHLDSFPQDELAIVFAAMKAKNIDFVLNPAIDLETSEAVLQLADAYESVLPAIGIHPGEAVELTEDVKRRLYSLSIDTRVVAVGEIGLDYSPKPGGREAVIENKEWQKDLLRYQLALAKERAVPVNIHYTLTAHRDIIAILHEEDSRGITGVAHGFQGGPGELRDWLDLGFCVSVGPSSLGLIRTPGDTLLPLADEVVRAIPLDRLLTETDCICMRPASLWKRPPGPADDGDMGDMRTLRDAFRQPSDVVDVAGRIASITRTNAEEIGTIATANLRRILKA